MFFAKCLIKRQLPNVFQTILLQYTLIKMRNAESVLVGSNVQFLTLTQLYIPSTASRCELMLQTTTYIETQDQLGQKRPLRSLNQTINMKQRGDAGRFFILTKRRHELYHLKESISIDFQGTAFSSQLQEGCYSCS